MSSVGGSRVEYFDAIAPRWESIVDSGRIRQRLSPVLNHLGIGADEQILDVGCGTGILTSLLLPRLSPRGRVSAVDFSGAMLDLAREKVSDGRVTWIPADVSALPLPGECIDRVIAFSTWPHFPDPDAVIRELRRVLRPGGRLHVIHIDSRATINAIHTHAGGVIGRDHLVPASDLAAALIRSGFQVASTTDNGERYVVTAAKDHAP